MTRPTCAHCGKLYGRRDTKTETVRWETPTKRIPARGPHGETHATMPDGDPLPPPRYTGNGVVVKETSAFFSSATDSMVMHREIWDGTSWCGGYDPFCTLRCALAYARRAYARTIGKRGAA